MTLRSPMMPIVGPPADMQNYNVISKNNDYFMSEYVINETPLGTRTLLTKGYVQDDISSFSGAAISTRGRFMSKNDHVKNPTDRPLYLFIQGPTKQNVEMAIQKVEEIVRKENNGGSCQSFNRAGEPDNAKMSGNVQFEKIFVGLENIPPFELRNKIIGQGGSHLQYIRDETGAAVNLRGRGSQYVDHQLGHESPEAMHLYIEHSQSEGLLAAKRLAVNLIETLTQELQQAPSDAQTVNISNSQMMNLPSCIPGMPPLSIPPPQQFSAMPAVQPSQNISLNNNPAELQGQVQQIRSQQIQHVQQLNQPPQSVILQQPPPLARAPIVSIPPPGIHIPQHSGPLVPPPQIVQLSGPPPTAASSGNVLVVTPQPSQSMYLSSDLASSSASSFSILQGGVLYHQAPPIQTQAQIGDGLHIISAPPQTAVDNINISLNSHTQPPPHMIITQVQLEPTGQSGDQISFQQPVVSKSQQFHVIGHVQTTISQENFTHMNNQTSTPSTMIFSVPSSQNPQIQLSTVVQSQGVKQIHTSAPGFVQQRPRISVQLSAAGNQIQTTEQLMLSQQPPPNPQQGIMNQIINQIPNGFISNQSNQPQQPQQHIQLNSQQVMMSQQELAPSHQLMINQQDQSISIQSQMPQSQLPPNQMPQSQMPPNQMPPRQLPPPPPPPHHLQFTNQTYDHPITRQEICNRINVGRNIRKANRNIRQSVYPWNKSDDKKYQNDSSWSKRDNDKRHDDYNGGDHFGSFSERNQYDSEKRKSGISNSNNNLHNQRNYQQFDKSEGKLQESNSIAWKMSESCQDDVNIETGRKRKFESDNNWNSRSDISQSSASESNHKTRFESEESNLLDQGFKQKLSSHKSSNSNIFGQTDQSKPDKENASKWLEQSGDVARIGNFDKHEDNTDDSKNIDSQAQMESNMEKRIEQSSDIHSQLIQPTSWNEQRADFKGTPQYATATSQFPMQNIDGSDKQFTQQPNFVYQNYLVPPPPPPPSIQFQASTVNHISPMRAVNTVCQPISIQNPTSVPQNQQRPAIAHILPTSVVTNIQQQQSMMPPPYITQSSVVPMNMISQGITSNDQINTTNVSASMGQNISLSIGQMPISIQQQQPTMVPPPSVSNVVPFSSRPQMSHSISVGASTSIHAVSQPQQQPYPFWMTQ